MPRAFASPIAVLVRGVSFVGHLSDSFPIHARLDAPCLSPPSFNRMALPKAHRLRDRNLFDDLRKKGIRRRSRTMTLWILSRSPQPEGVSLTPEDPEELEDPKNSDISRSPIPTQFGVAVSKKVHKRAVVRNRLRRHIHRAIQTLLPRIKPGWCIRISVRNAALECNPCQFLQELETLLSEIEVLHGR